MNRWFRRAVIYGLLAGVLTVAYFQMTDSGWSRHDMLIAFGALFAISSIGGFFPAPENKYSDFLAGPRTRRGRVILSSIWLATGVALIAWAVL
jgi:hypothetical protein